MGLTSFARTITGRPRLSLRSPPRASPGPTISHHRASASALPSQHRRRSSLLLPSPHDAAAHPLLSFPHVVAARPRRRASWCVVSPRTPSILSLRSCRVVLSHPLRPSRTARRPTLTSEVVVSLAPPLSPPPSPPPSAIIYSSSGPRCATKRSLIFALEGRKVAVQPTLQWDARGAPTASATHERDGLLLHPSHCRESPPIQSRHRVAQPSIQSPPAVVRSVLADPILRYASESWDVVQWTLAGGAAAPRPPVIWHSIFPRMRSPSQRRATTPFFFALHLCCCSVNHISLSGDSTCQLTTVEI
jgi:hypothetical protein